MHLQLDLVDEVRAVAEQRLARYQNLMAKHYNSRVRHRDFQVRDLVLRKVTGTTRDPSQGKLGPNWEGSYRITLRQRKGTYHLETLDRQKLHHPWNTEHLKKILPIDNGTKNNTPYFQFTSFQLNFFYLQYFLSHNSSFLFFQGLFFFFFTYCRIIIIRGVIQI